VELGASHRILENRRINQATSFKGRASNSDSGAGGSSRRSLLVLAAREPAAEHIHEHVEAFRAASAFGCCVLFQGGKILVAANQHHRVVDRFLHASHFLHQRKKFFIRFDIVPGFNGIEDPGEDNPILDLDGFEDDLTVGVGEGDADTVVYNIPRWTASTSDEQSWLGSMW
jgi:hypothetical protein